MPNKKWYFLAWTVCMVLAVVAYVLSPDRQWQILCFWLFFITGLCIAIYYARYSVWRYKSAVDSSNTELFYHSPYCAEDCISFLSRRNVRDTMIYEFSQEDDAICYISFSGKEPEEKGRFNTRYRLAIQEAKEGSSLQLSFVSEVAPFPAPLVYSWWVDDFMKQKLDAVRVRPAGKQ